MSNWPRIRDLPTEEQKPFLEYLNGKTRPLMEPEEDYAPEDQDAFYQSNYDRWKAVLAGKLVIWD